MECLPYVYTCVYTYGLFGIFAGHILPTMEVAFASQTSLQIRDDGYLMDGKIQQQITI